MTLGSVTAKLLMSPRSHPPSPPARRPGGTRWRLLVLLACLPAGAHAEPIELSLGVASATVLRGVALGEGGVDANVAASYADTQGWRFAVGATALHAHAARQRWDTQLFARLGYAQRLDDDWSVQMAYARYAYPGSALLRRYGRDELGLTVAWRDLLYLSMAGLRRTHAGAGESRHSLAYDIVAHQPLPAALTLSAGVGRLQARGSGFAYGYGHLGLGTQWGATQAQLAYIITGSNAKQRFGAVAANRWTASLSWDL